MVDKKINIYTCIFGGLGLLLTSQSLTSQLLGEANKCLCKK